MSNRKRFNEIEHEVISLGAMQLDIIERLKSLECHPGYQEPTPRQRVAEEFLTAAMDGKSYDYAAARLRNIIANSINYQSQGSTLRDMAAVLERAAKELGDA